MVATKLLTVTVPQLTDIPVYRQGGAVFDYELQGILKIKRRDREMVLGLKLGACD